VSWLGHFSRGFSRFGVPALALGFVIVFSASAYYDLGVRRALVEFALLATCLQTGFVSPLLISIVPGLWRRLMKPRELSRPAAPSMAAARRHKVF
jgi:hypothetical protein